MDGKALSLLGCSGSIAAILSSATLASPDTKQTIPYPEVMNLETVPTFTYQGIVAQETTPNRLKLTKTRDRRGNTNLTARSQTVVELAIQRLGCDCLSCQNQIRTMMNGDNNLYSAIPLY
jgi:hypothetical protein